MAFYVPQHTVQLVREKRHTVEKKKVSGSQVACEFFQQFFDDLGSPQEVVAVATLNTKNVITGVSIITKGTQDASLVHPREVFRYAILQGASSIILAHNHPSGDPTPSKEDHAVTRRLTDVGKLVGIDVLDHIVVGDTAVSIREVV